jgi:serine/threonine-protein kinase HipA
VNITALQVRTPQGESGALRTGKSDYIFRYADQAPAAAALSLTMPVRVDEYRHPALHPVFQMNLPEGYVLEQLRNRLAKTSKLDPMLLLALAGSTSPIGRIFVRSEAIDALVQKEASNLGEKLEEILAWDGTEDLFVDLVERYILRAGISGVQPKVLVPEQLPGERFTTNTSDLIIKSGREEFPHLAINEFLCMSIAKEAGLPVPEFFLSNNMQLFVVRRFDRDDQLNPLGFEDMAALMGLSAEQKYEKSYSHIAKAVRLYCPTEHLRSSLDQLFDIVALSCIVGNGDAHLKNFGLLYSDPTQRDARLAPVYDIVNTTAYIPEDSLALELAGNKSLFAARQSILDFATTCDIEAPKERIQRLLAAVETVILKNTEHVEEAPAIAKAIEDSAELFKTAFT